MARRKRNEGLLDVLAELPWWVTLVLGVVMLCVPAQGNPVISLVCWMFACACFVAALVGAIKSLVRKSLFSSANDIEAIRAMSWRAFETLVGEAYRRQGYSVEETGGGGADGGIDLILRGKGQKTLVQCKQWRTFKVGVKTIREMYGIMVAENADRVIVATSGVYTQEALSFARGKPIELMDGKALVQLISEVKRQSETILTPTLPARVPSTAPDAPQKTLSVQTHAAHACPRCGATMVQRIARKGINAGNPFWGCPRYPACKGIVNVW